MTDNWKPDPDILEQFKKEVEKQPNSLRVGAGTRVLTWNDIVKEIEAGTKLGRKIYDNYVKGLERQ